MIDTLIAAYLLFDYIILGCVAVVLTAVAMLMGADLLLTRITITFKLWRDPSLDYPLPRAWRAARRHTS